MLQHVYISLSQFSLHFVDDARLEFTLNLAQILSWILAVAPSCQLPDISIKLIFLLR